MTLKRHTVRHLVEHYYNLTDESTGRTHAAKIVFCDGKFFECEFPFRGTYSRDQWAALAELENEICRIEQNQ